jgi:hypothetical protein
LWGLITCWGGDGNADNLQVQKLVKMMLGLSEVPKPDDAANALAVAVSVVSILFLESPLNSAIPGNEHTVITPSANSFPLNDICGVFSLIFFFTWRLYYHNLGLDSKWQYGV